ncbi:MAG: hypothetical protein GVY05_06550 [Bacteroidetes bacterium]|jgi:hypothetical protein|nr:hypothetical protein [Bacteroidota bacterium]
MKTNLFIKFSLCLLLALSGYAQTSKTYSESFNVNKDVKVFLNANNAEITVETWNKNRVDVEATISVELEDKTREKQLLDKIPFEALGNSGKVEINSVRDRPRFFAGKNKFIADDAVVEILTEDIKGVRPPAPPKPPLPDIDFDFNFDMERFNEEGKAYVLKFQKEIREKMKDSILQKKMKLWQKDFVEGFNKDSDSVSVYTFKKNAEAKPRIKVIRGNFDTDFDERKVKKKIIIKMPKDAKLNLNVKRSQLEVAKLSYIDANLNYSGLQIGELTGNDSKISANHSKVTIDNAKTLDLDLKYSKEVKIGSVQELVSLSKTSNLVIKNIGQKAIIEGTFGELEIKKINDNFKFIDINLKNSTAVLKIPHDDINFYINSKSSDFNQNTGIDFKMNSISDAVIYQNSKSVSGNQNINIKANFSTLELN